MNALLLAALLVAGPAAANGPMWDSLKEGRGFDGATGSATDELLIESIDKASGLTGETLRKTREGETRLLQRAVDESPALTRALRDAARRRSWNDYYQDRIVDAAVASWGSNVKAGYLKGTAAAYATYHTAPPVVDFVAGGALWVVGVVYGLGLTALAVAFTGHL